MKHKYECTVCSRMFMHKETLEEHNRLHGLVIKEGHSYSCPICLKEVVCSLNSHSHTNSIIEPHHSPNLPLKTDSDSMCSDMLDQNETEELVATTVHIQADAKGSKRGRRSKQPVEIEVTPGKDISSSDSHCVICQKTFVYAKCLMKHLRSVHGINEESLENETYKTSVVPHSGDVLLDVVQQNRFPNVEPYDKFSEALSKSSKDMPETQENVCEVQRNDGIMTHEVVNSVISEVHCSQKTKTGVPSKFACKTCAKEFKYKTTLVRHWRIVHGGLKCDKCACPICSENFDSQMLFSKHFDSVHKKMAAELLSKSKDGSSDSDVNDGAVYCEACRQWFTCQRSLSKHCGLKHRVIQCSLTGQMRYKCVHCSETFETNRQLLYHRHNKHYGMKSKDDSADKSTHGNNVESAKDVMIKSEISGDSSSSDGTVVDFPDNDENSCSVPKLKKKIKSKYFCTECSKSFASTAFLVRHRKLKHGNRPAMGLEKNGIGKPKKQLFVCGVCSEEFNFEETLNEHMEFIHRGYRIETGDCACPLCVSTFYDQASFSAHFDVYHRTNVEAQILAEGDPVPQCKTCGHWFTDRRALIAHQCPKRPPVRLKPAGRARYRCSQCGEAFEVLRRFLHHRKVKHCMEGPISAEVNQWTMPMSSANDSTVSVVEIMETVKDPASYCTRGRPPKFSDTGESEVTSAEEGIVSKIDEDLPDEGSSLKCPECHRSFRTTSLLRKHRKAEHRNRTCQLCGETCKSADMVYYHNLKFHHEQKCDVCGASCPGRLGLIQHFRSEHPNEPPPLINRKTLICEYCPRVFAGCASRLLRDHIESCHQGRVHLCDVCGKRLGSAQTLAVHRRMHDPVARFACNDCNRRFPHNTNLINHIRKHHPERLPAKYVREFRCEVCSMQFGSSSGLTRHRSEKHGPSRHQCDLCLRVFQSMTGLRMHKRREHSNKDDNNVPVSAAASLQPPPDAQQLLMVPVAFAADPTMMAGLLAGLPGMTHPFQ